MNEDITSSISSDISSYKTSEDISDEKKELVDDDYVDIDKGMVDDDDNDDDNDDDDNDDKVMRVGETKRNGEKVGVGWMRCPIFLVLSLW